MTDRANQEGLRKALQQHIEANLPTAVRVLPEGSLRERQVQHHIQGQCIHLQERLKKHEAMATSQDLQPLFALYACAATTTIQAVPQVQALISTLLSTAQLAHAQMLFSVLPIIAVGGSDADASRFDRLLAVLQTIATSVHSEGAQTLIMLPAVLHETVSQSVRLRWPAGLPHGAKAALHACVHGADRRSGNGPMACAFAMVLTSCGGEVDDAWESTCRLLTEETDGLRALSRACTCESHARALGLVFLLTGVRWGDVGRLGSMRGVVLRAGWAVCRLVHEGCADSLACAEFGHREAALRALLCGLCKGADADAWAVVTTSLHGMVSARGRGRAGAEWVAGFAREVMQGDAVSAISAVGLLEVVARLDGRFVGNELRKLVWRISREFTSVSRLAWVVCGRLVVDSGHEGRVSSFQAGVLLQCVGNALLQSGGREVDGADEADGARGEDELVWIILSTFVLGAIERDDVMVKPCVDFLIAVIASLEWAVSAARAVVIVGGVRTMLRRMEGQYGRGGVRNSDLLLTVRLMDAIAKNVSDGVEGDGDLFHEGVDAIVTGVGQSDGRLSRLGCLVLLRCMIHCDIPLIPVVQAGLTRVIGTSQEGRQKFMGICRVAVVGADMRRKDVCLEWLLRTFNGQMDAVTVSKRRIKQANL